MRRYEESVIPQVSANNIDEDIAKIVHNFDGDQDNQTELDEIQLLIRSCRIDLSEPLSPAPVAMQIVSDGKPITLFTKGNFSIVTGPAKSRKSFLVSMLMAAAIKGEFSELFTCPSSGVNIIFDTEQSRYKTQQIGKRICNLSQSVVNSTNLQVYSLRTLDPSQRIALIDCVLSTTPNINFVAIDGIIDLDIDPILQADQAQNIVSHLMKWTEIYNIHIVCVLHFNKTVATLLGHLGSFSHRKADAIISVTKSKDDPSISIVEPVDCREKEFQPFAFSVDQSGMPYLMGDFTFEKKAKPSKKAAVDKPEKPKGISPVNIEASKHEEILINVFAIEKELGYGDLWRNVKLAFEKVMGQPIGDNKVKDDFVPYYIAEQSIIKTESIKKKPVYVLPGQMELAV